ncbi:hypothetical protein FQA39_LY19103 [Lamprigera yunnana]|nr:hypothetical protein FQA39_LY19103 [Lamprigera yunnana]
MSIIEKPSRSRGKKEPNVDENERRVYSAQFNGRQKIKHKHERSREETNSDFNKLEKRSHQFGNENHESEYFKRKALHLKEKLSKLKIFNGEILQENTIIKDQYEDLLMHLKTLKEELTKSKNCKNCESLKTSLGKVSSDNDALKLLNQQLTQDVNMLKNVVYRLNVQMECYQVRFRKYKVANTDTTNFELVKNEEIDIFPKDHLDHSHTPLSWGSVNSHTLGPLLDAYQESLDEKEEIIQNYEDELSHFTGRLQEIIIENEKLHKRLTEDDECSSKLSVELDKLKEELKNTKAENDLLIKKCALKQNKLEEVLQCYEQKVDQLRRDYNVVVEQYHKSRTEVAALKEKNKVLIDSQDEFKSERQNYISLAMHNSSVNECKKWYEELKHQYEQEKLKLEELVDSLQQELNTLNQNIQALKVEKDELETKTKSLEKHIKKCETKNVELQRSFQEMLLSRNACRKQLHKAMTFAKELVTEQETLMRTLHLRQKENKAVKQIGSDIATRMDSLKSQLKVVQKEAWQELTTVEQRLQDQDTMISEMKREHSEEVERLKDIIKLKQQKV